MTDEVDGCSRAAPELWRGAVEAPVPAAMSWKGVRP